MNNALYHLVIFLACIASLTAIILTGHDSSPLLHQIVGGVFGGILGGSGASAAPLLLKLFRGPDDPTATAPVTVPRSAGFIRMNTLLLMLALMGLAGALTACAGLRDAIQRHPIATACASSSAALKTITVASQAGALTVSDRQSVNTALAVVTPICSAPVEPSPTAATLAALSGAVAQLQTAAAHYSQN